MIDCKQLPVPKYKVGDKVWIVDYSSVKQVEVSCVEISGRWFDNGHTSRHEFQVEYELTTAIWSSYTEDKLYSSQRSAQRKLSKQKVETRKNKVEELRRDLALLKSHCSLYGLTIDDL